MSAVETKRQRPVRLAKERASFLARPRTLLVCLGLLVAVVGVSLVTIGTGEYPMSVPDVVRTLLGGGDQSMHFVVMTLRLPRVLVACFVGAALGVSGGIFQSLTRNPLGSPDIIGFTSGAATGALVAIIGFGGGSARIALAALVGGIVTAAAVYLLAYRKGVQGYRLVLVGIGISAVLTSINSYLLTRADLTTAQNAAIWLVGSLNGRGWEHVRPVGLALLVLLPLAFALGRRLLMLEMGDDVCKALGIPVERSRLALVLVAVALCAVAVASAGPIAFVALAAPQVARRLTRAPGPGLAAAALMGALVLTASDLGAQRLLAPTQLPVGVMTGLVGGCYLAWLLSREWRSGRA